MLLHCRWYRSVPRDNRNSRCTVRLRRNKVFIAAGFAVVRTPAPFCQTGRIGGATLLTATDRKVAGAAQSVVRTAECLAASEFQPFDIARSAERTTFVTATFVVDFTWAAGRAATRPVVCTRCFAATALFTWFQTVITTTLPPLRASRLPVAALISLLQACSAAAAVALDSSETRPCIPGLFATRPASAARALRAPGFAGALVTRGNRSIRRFALFAFVSIARHRLAAPNRDCTPGKRRSYRRTD